MSSSSSALNLLSVYNDSDSDSEDEIPGPRVSVKRTKSYGEDAESTCKNKLCPLTFICRLPLPSAVSQLFQSENVNDRTTDSPDEHKGRIRSFPHERGNWASLVYVAVDSNESLQSFIDVVCTVCNSSVQMQRSDDLHISLTKTVILKHHWIDPISSSVQTLAQSMTRFPVCFGEVKVYTNEEKTRTFIGIVVTAGNETLKYAAHRLDEILSDFKLPSFYEEASFHLSIASCVGNQADILNALLPSLQSSLNMFIHSQPSSWSLSIDKIHFKTGNKIYVFNLIS
ncbi:hypothetical protein ONE63_006589 [Megalurothrips usitatus]|uniref:U6 snRNA phosphodiesterase n=1 Tax=Megalurothrips usitatus TaxID=439358 RepID=A0AAV7XTW0_9NEOP|nr:hypothetical protein ONE63_006589 [Megalurothrips usitatus]